MAVMFDNPVYDNAKKLNLSDDVISNLLDGNYETITLRQIGSRVVLYGKLPEDINEIIISADAKDEETVNAIRELGYYSQVLKDLNSFEEIVA